MSTDEQDADFYADPIKERMVEAPWHTALHYNAVGDEDEAQEMMVAVPDYDPIDPNDEDGFFVRVDTLQVDSEGETTATSILWDVRELSRFCHQTLALLQADRIVERAVLADAGDDDDEGEEGEEGEEVEEVEDDPEDPENAE